MDLSVSSPEFEHTLKLLVCQCLQILVCLSLNFIGVFLNNVYIIEFGELVEDSFYAFSSQTSDPELLSLKAVDKYVSDAVKAGATALNYLLPRKLSHAFQEFSTAIPVIAK